MKTNWKTQKGDEWCFENKYFKGHADRLPYASECTDSAIVINGIYSKRRVTSRAFLGFLSDTNEQFPGHGIILKFQGNNEQMVPYERLLNNLIKKDYIHYRVSSVSQSKYECVRKWVNQSHKIVEVIVSNKRPGLLLL